MPKTLFVGCNVSSKNNTVCLMDEEGKEMGYPTFPNTLSEEKALESQLLQLIKEKGFSTLKIATDATSFLDLHLVDFSASSQDLAPFNPSIYQFNPKLVRNFKTAYSDKEKTHKIDAFVITDRLRFGRLPEPYERHRPYLPLWRLTRYQFHLIQTISREKAYFLTHPYLKFSAFSLEKPFAFLFGATTLTLIPEFYPGELLHLPWEDLTYLIIQNGTNRFRTHKKWSSA